MSRVETIVQQETLEMRSPSRLTAEGITGISVRMIRANIAEISGFRSVNNLNISRLDRRLLSALRSGQSRVERKSGGGGRCKRKGVHEHGKCGSPFCRVPKSIFANNTAAASGNDLKVPNSRRDSSERKPKAA